jgi:NADPH:quinone reductase-like Zn-dependent oxidoreductase
VTAKGQDPVKAIVQDRFGPPEVLRLADTGVPEAGPDDVLVRVHAAALNPADWHILRGDPLVAWLMGVGLTRPKARVAGIDAAGVVEAAGANVRRLANGDDVLDPCLQRRWPRGGPAAAQVKGSGGRSVSDRESPWVTLLKGMWRARAWHLVASLRPTTVPRGEA